MALRMKFSERGIMMLMRFEGFGATSYYDEACHKTIGYGHRIQSGEIFDRKLTREEAQELLLADVLPVENAVRKLVKVPLSQQQYDALVSFVFNVGIKAFGNSTMLCELNAGHYTIAADEFLKWNKVHSGGAVLESPGLTARRAAESRWFREKVRG